MRSLLTVLALIAGALVAGVGPASAIVDRDCSDFSSQAAAQQFFINAGGPQQDPHRLDGDNDGTACDSLPCPCSSSTGGGSSLPARITQYGRVTDVVDGDTADVRLSSTGNVRRVRFIGIDTPEVYGGTECGGPEASAYLKQMLPAGTRVKLVSDRTQDRVDAYGRILRYVTKTSNGRDVNRAQVWKGWARVYVYDNNPFERVTAYRNAQASAQAAPRGIWKIC
jgi:endonuclease YncB( thermonuclease family)